jgi:hypothetical protein
VDLATIIGFDEKQVFNLYQNQNAYGYVSQQYFDGQEKETITKVLSEMINLIKTLNEELRNRNV